MIEKERERNFVLSSVKPLILISILFCLVLFLFKEVSYASGVSTKSEPLKGEIIVLDPGHGGSDPGALYKQLVEKNLSLQEAHYLKTDLEKLGATVILTRNTDNYISLDKRAELPKKVHADLFISLHANASRLHHLHGMTVYYNNYVFKGDENNYPILSKRLAFVVHSSMKQLPMHDFGIRSNDFKVLRKNSVPSILIELGYLDNKNDRKLLEKTAFIKTAMKSIANGVKIYCTKN